MALDWFSEAVPMSDTTEHLPTRGMKPIYVKQLRTIIYAPAGVSDQLLALLSRPTAGDEGAKPIAFERASDLVAKQISVLLSESLEPSRNDKLMAAHIVGNLWANDLLNTAGEKWEPVNCANQSTADMETKP